MNWDTLKEILPYIWLCLLVAAILGAVIGWLLRTIFGGGNQAERDRYLELERKMNTALTSKEQETNSIKARWNSERTELEAQVTKLNDDVADCKESKTNLLEQYKSTETELRTALDGREKEIASIRTELKEATSSLTARPDSNLNLDKEFSSMRLSLVERDGEIDRLKGLLAVAGAGVAGAATKGDTSASEAEITERIEAQYRNTFEANEAEIARLKGLLESANSTSVVATPVSVSEEEINQRVEAQFRTVIETKEAEIVEKEEEINRLQRLLALTGAGSAGVAVGTVAAATNTPSEEEIAARVDANYRTLLETKDSEISRLNALVQDTETKDSGAVQELDTRYRTLISERDMEITTLRSKIRELESNGGRTDLIKIIGIGEVYYGKLLAAGVPTQAELLRQGATVQGRKEIGKRADIDPSLILRWVNHVDLMRISGVNESLADLLEDSGVDTVLELSKRVPENLHNKIQETHAQNRSGLPIPSLDEVRNWITQARELPPMVTH